MKRNIDALTQQAFDVVVIGGGIYGAWTAYDAALRGLDVALIEKDDWGAGTSSSSTKLLHGGLRYLERLEVGMVRKSLSERRLLTRIAPHQVWPLRFMVPAYRGARVSKLRMRIGLSLYDMLAGHGQPVPAHTSLRRADTRRDYGFLAQHDLLGGFTYGDCGLDDARFTLEIVAGAIAAGATAVNHVRVDALLRDNDRVCGVRCADARHNFEVRARQVVNTAGPWVGDFESAAPTRTTKGVHLVMPPLPTADALLLMAHRDGRVFFMVPWYGRTLLGTTDTDFTEQPQSVAVTQADIDYLLAEAGSVLGEPWTTDDICGSFAGLRTLYDEPGRSPSDVSREWRIIETTPGLLSSIGGKLTSARTDAADIVDHIEKLLGRPPSPSLTDRPTPWCPHGDFDEWQKTTTAQGVACGLDDETGRQLTRRYGTRTQRVFDIIAEDPARAARIVPELPFCLAEIVMAHRHEMALTTEDVIRRRIPISILTKLDDETLATIEGIRSRA